MTDAERADMTCLTCVWFRLHTGAGYAEGSCRRYPPTVVLDADSLPTFPAVYKAWWCGEWRPGSATTAPPR